MKHLKSIATFESPRRTNPPSTCPTTQADTAHLAMQPQPEDTPATLLRPALASPAIPGIGIEEAAGDRAGRETTQLGVKAMHVRKHALHAGA